MIGIEFCGDNCVAAVHAAVASMGTEMVYVSADSATGKADVEAFYNYTEMSMKV